VFVKEFVKNAGLVYLLLDLYWPSGLWQLEYSKQDTVSTLSTGSEAPDAMKIVHKEQDQLICFCVNQVKLQLKVYLFADVCVVVNRITVVYVKLVTFNVHNLPETSFKHGTVICIVAVNMVITEVM